MQTKMKGFGVVPDWFMPSTRARPVRLEKRIDLVPASNPPSYGGNKLIPFSYSVPKNQALVVQGIVCALWQRVDIGGAHESCQLLTNIDVAGKVVFTPIVNGQLAFQSENEVNQFTTLATASNAPVRSSGITTVSENPDTDLFGNWFNPLFSFVVRSEQLLQVLFEVLPVTNGETLEITDDAKVTNRVDFAGVYLVGQLLSDADFTALQQEM